MPLLTGNLTGPAFNTPIGLEIEAVSCIHYLSLFNLVNFNQGLFRHLGIELIEIFLV